MVVLLAGVGSYLLRMSMISTDRFRLPRRAEESVEMVAPAAFAALAATNLATAVLDAATLARAMPILAAIVAAVVATAWSRRAYASMLAGMPAFWLTAAIL
jgi:branched-subunit amino acid transport protein